jgi:hypothetical protein
MHDVMPEGMHILPKNKRIDRQGQEEEQNRSMPHA